MLFRFDVPIFRAFNFCLLWTLIINIQVSFNLLSIVVFFVFFSPTDVESVPLYPITVCLVDVFSFGNFENAVISSDNYLSFWFLLHILVVIISRHIYQISIKFLM